MGEVLAAAMGEVRAAMGEVRAAMGVGLRRAPTAIQATVPPASNNTVQETTALAPAPPTQAGEIIMETETKATHLATTQDLQATQAQALLATKDQALLATRDQAPLATKDLALLATKELRAALLDLTLRRTRWPSRMPTGIARQVSSLNKSNSFC